MVLVQRNHISVLQDRFQGVRLFGSFMLEISSSKLLLDRLRIDNDAVFGIAGLFAHELVRKESQASCFDWLTFSFSWLIVPGSRRNSSIQFLLVGY